MQNLPPRGAKTCRVHEFLTVVPIALPSNAYSASRNLMTHPFQCRRVRHDGAIE